MPNYILSRRSLLAAAVPLALGMGYAPAFAQAPAFPTQTVRLIVPTAAGAGMDLSARLLADKLGTAWGKPVIVDNRPGGNGQVGLNAFRAARGDPHTILVADIGLVSIMPSVPGGIEIEPRKELQPITDIFYTSFVILAQPGRYSSLQDVLRAAKDHPGKLNYASSGISSGQRLSVEMLKAQTGRSITFIPYKGNADALNALLAGEVDLVSIGLPPAKGHIESGRLKALALTAPQRSEALPQVPTVAEAAGVSGFSADSWVGLFASPTTSAATVAMIQRDVAAALKAPDFVKFMQTNDYTSGGNASTAFAQQTERDREKYHKLITELKLSFQ